MSDATQHFSATGITSTADEESYQAAEYDAFFNSDDGSDESAEPEAYMLTDADAASIVHDLQVTNGLLGTLNAILIVFAIFGVMRFIMRLVNHNIFNYI